RAPSGLQKIRTDPSLAERRAAERAQRGQADLESRAPQPEAPELVVRALDREPVPRLRHREGRLEYPAGDFLAADERRVDALGGEPGRQPRGVADEVDVAGKVEAGELDLDRRALVRGVTRIDPDLGHAPLDVRPDGGRPDLALGPARADAHVVLVREHPEIAAGEDGRIKCNREIEGPRPGNVVLAGEERTRGRKSQRLAHARSGAVRADQMAVSQRVAGVADGAGLEIDPRDRRVRANVRARRRGPLRLVPAEALAREGSDPRMHGVERDRRLAPKG